VYGNSETPNNAFQIFGVVFGCHVDHGISGTPGDSVESISQSFIGCWTNWSFNQRCGSEALEGADGQLRVGIRPWNTGTFLMSSISPYVHAGLPIKQRHALQCDL